MATVVHSGPPRGPRVRHSGPPQVDVVLLQIALGFCALLMRYLSRTATTQGLG